MIRLITLGGLSGRAGDDVLSGAAGRPRTLAVLALLARAGERGVSRDRVCALLWPESDAARARHSLDQVLYTLRRALGGDPLRGGTDPMVLDRSIVAADVVHFEEAIDGSRWRDAVALHAGPFLDGIHLAGAGPEWEEWVEGERAALGASWRSALEHLARDAEATGDHVAAAGWWRRRAAAEPLSSPPVLRLMQALAAAGDVPGALAAARAHEALVRSELGAAADPEVAALAGELRARLDMPSEWTAAPPDRPPQPAPARRAFRPPLRLRLVAGLGAVAAAGILTITGLSKPEEPSLPVIAVASFKNGTGDPSHDATAALAADWIARELHRTGLVQVVEPGAGSVPDAERIVGSLQRVGDSLWFRVRLLTPTGRTLRMLDPVYTPDSAPLGALLPLRRSVLAAVGTRHDPALAAFQGTATRPPALEAYRELARGIESYHRFEPEALDHFRRASALDSSYLLPRLWAAWLLQATHAWEDSDSILRGLAGVEAGLTPLERAWIDRMRSRLRGDFEESYLAARRMARLAPASGWISALHNAAMDTRRAAEAARVLERTPPAALGPGARHYWAGLAAALHARGEHARERATLERGAREGGRHWSTLRALALAHAAVGDLAALDAVLVELAPMPVGAAWQSHGSTLAAVAGELRVHGRPESADPYFRRAIAWFESRPGGAMADPWLRWEFAEAAYEGGEWSLAGKLADTLRAELPDELSFQGMLGIVAARQGRRAEAEAIAESIATRTAPFEFGWPAMWRAEIAAVLGRPDTAVALVRDAIARGIDQHNWYLLLHLRDFDALRGRSDFSAAVGPRE